MTEPVVTKDTVRDALAKVLDFDKPDGTYYHILTRSKSAFSVGTVSIEDFEEVDDDFLDQLVEAVLPFMGLRNTVKRKANKGERIIVTANFPDTPAPRGSEHVVHETNPEGVWVIGSRLMLLDEEYEVLLEEEAK